MFSYNLVVATAISSECIEYDTSEMEVLSSENEIERQQNKCSRKKPRRQHKIDAKKIIYKKKSK